MEDKDSLEKLKEKYFILEKKYKLPKFDDLNEDFSVEKIFEIETDYLLREIRRFMSEKIVNYLRFIESLIQPINVPLFIFSIVKTIGNEEKEKLSNLYKKLVRLEVNLWEIDMKYSEEKEANYITEAFNIWQDVKKDNLEIIEVIKKNWDVKSEVNGKNYFG